MNESAASAAERLLQLPLGLFGAAGKVDADRVTEYYRNHGYVRANLGEPEVKVLEDSADKKTRWIELRIPISEGNRYKVGEFKFDGNKVIRSEGLRNLFKVKTGDYYNNKKIAPKARVY